MNPKSTSLCRGLFVTGTDTDVGKTYVTALIARSLRAAGHRVGVYKPAASGCRLQEGRLVADDALALWEAAGRPASLEQVCPQRFAAPLAPHLAARAEGKELDPQELRRGLEPWLHESDIVLVEGAGGLMCPMGDDEYVADLAADFGFPLVVVAANRLGTINHTLQTLITAAAFGEGLDVAGIVLNHPAAPLDDASLATNRREIADRAGAPVLAEVRWEQHEFSEPVDWYALAAEPRRSPGTL
ncbi:MAG: dethiobiotin synthase [Thermoguttaceae bacterium]